MSAVGLLYVAFVILRCTFSMHNKLRIFIVKGCCILANTLLASIEEIGTPWWLNGKESACSAGDLGSIPVLEDPLER